MRRLTRALRTTWSDSCENYGLVSGEMASSVSVGDGGSSGASARVTDEKSILPLLCPQREIVVQMPFRRCKY